MNGYGGIAWAGSTAADCCGGAGSCGNTGAGAADETSAAAAATATGSSGIPASATCWCPVPGRYARCYGRVSLSFLRFGQ